MGVRYFKDYSANDQVNLSFNGLDGVVQNVYKSDIEGTNILFLFQPTSQAMNGKLKLSIKNDQKTVEKEQNFRIVEDLNLKTVWNALDKTYLSGFDRQIDRFKTGTFALNTFSPADLGLYVDNTLVLSDRYGKTLIPGLQGKYELNYTGGILSEIKVSHGEPQANASFSSKKTYADIAAVYGNYISRVQQNEFEVTMYETGEFSLNTYLSPAIMYTIVRKK